MTDQGLEKLLDKMNMQVMFIQDTSKKLKKQVDAFSGSLLKGTDSAEPHILIGGCMPLIERTVDALNRSIQDMRVLEADIDDWDVKYMLELEQDKMADDARDTGVLNA